MKATASLKLCLLFAWIAIGISCKKESATALSPQLITASVVDSNEIDEQALSGNSTMSDSVFICVSKGAKRYHYDDSCRGLKRCTHTIEKTTKKKAEAIGLTVCGYEQ